jgi:glycosyltransferase involved in cell wall biosynthesis
LPSVSVVAPTYRRRQALPGFIEPLLRQPGLDELVVAVDGSEDGSVEWLHERARSDPRIVTLDLTNRGAGGARQAGVEAATKDVVVLMDDDVIASPGLVEGHKRHHERLEPRLVLGYMPNDWRALPHGRRGIAWIYRAAYESHVARWLADPAAVLHGMWGGNLSMPREKLLEVGIQKLAVKRGQDDREFGLRCLKAGVQGAFDPALHSVHLYDRDLPAFRRDCRVQGESRRMIHEVHDDLLGGALVREGEGPETPDDVGLGLPGPLRTVWPAVAGGAAFEPAIAAMERVFAFAVRSRHLGLEVFAARGIGSLETMHGVVAT